MDVKKVLFSLSLLAVVTLTALLCSCSGDVTVTPAPAITAFPKQSPPPASEPGITYGNDMLEIRGILRAADGYIRLDSVFSRQPVSYLIIWPHDFVLDNTYSIPQILDKDGKCPSRLTDCVSRPLF